MAFFTLRTRRRGGGKDVIGTRKELRRKSWDVDVFFPLLVCQVRKLQTVLPIENVNTNEYIYHKNLSLVSAYAVILAKPSHESADR